MNLNETKTKKPEDIKKAPKENATDTEKKKAEAKIKRFLVHCLGRRSQKV